MIGLALTAVGAYVFILTEEIGTAINNELSPIMLVLVVIGSVLVVTALIGFCGVFRKQSLFLSGVSKQPIRTRYLGHVTGYQPIREAVFWWLQL